MQERSLQGAAATGWELWGGCSQLPLQVVNMEGSSPWLRGLVWDLCYPRILLQAAFAHAVSSASIGP